MNVAVFGLGYVGSVTAACLAAEGHDVVGVDLDAQKVAAIRDGESPIVEPGLPELVRAARAAGRLDATTDVAAAARVAEVLILCVGTPSRRNGALDLSQIERVCEQIGGVLRESCVAYPVVVIRSTMVPGTVVGTVVPLLEQSHGGRVGRDFGVAMCPEFLRESTGVADFHDPPFTVIGSGDARTADTVEALFAFIDAPIHRVEIETAEALKYSCNAFHALKVAFANEIGRVCQASGADARNVMRIFCEDRRLNVSPAYLRPGFSFGGSCLPKDVRALVHAAQTVDVDLPLIGSILPSNDQHRRAAIDWILQRDVRTVALLGLSFKAGTDDLRESPYVELAETLIGKGVEVRIYDSIVHPERLTGSNRRFVEDRLPHLHRVLHRDPHSALEGVDCAVVTVREPHVVDALRRSAPPHVLDLCGGLGADLEAAAGYAGIAW